MYRTFEQRVRAELERVGQKVTPGRLHVARRFDCTSKPLSAAEVYGAVSRDGIVRERNTVYKILQELLRLKLLQVSLTSQGRLYSVRSEASIDSPDVSKPSLITSRAGKTVAINAIPDELLAAIEEYCDGDVLSVEISCR